MAFLIDPFSFLLSIAGNLGILGFTAFVIFIMVLSSFVWPYVLNIWLMFFGQRPAIAWWHGCILGMSPFFDSIMVQCCLFTTVFFIILNAVKQKINQHRTMPVPSEDKRS